MWYYLGFLFVAAASAGVIGSIEPSLNQYKTLTRARFGAVIYAVLAIICFVGLAPDPGSNNLFSSPKLTLDHYPSPAIRAATRKT
ncbi:hypothetical protein EDC56_3430 [Sinobacterium caligoides]|uniref:Uncharacterized protein n=1 Tax=Sinobacterium caligoides TaxID=933926 RepID=A0A3N2DH44_9GAMM|nr:hypothetical protein [Sinobacterium caligoides]ROR98694.1 hypothetical protein EDC56_3430 [Sinobacterium caligoides]